MGRVGNPAGSSLLSGTEHSGGDVSDGADPLLALAAHASPDRSIWIARRASRSPVRDRSGSHWMRTGEVSFEAAQAAGLSCGLGSKWPRLECASAHSNPVRVISMARMRSCSGLAAQPDRCIIQSKDGLIQVIRSRLNGATNVPARAAVSAIGGARTAPFRSTGWSRPAHGSGLSRILTRSERLHGATPGLFSPSALGTRSHTPN
jgi:hypothetical protein